MQEKVTITIDNKEITVPKGITIIDAAESAGIHIPNLCHIKGLKGIGACRLCMVEIEGLKAPMTACTTKVTKDGMKIKTTSDAINEIRKFVIDLIVSMHPLDCMTCTKAGDCNLQKYAFDFAVKESTFSRKMLNFAKDVKNPFIKRDPDYCVLCGRCVRICKSQGTNVLNFMDRGVGSKVTTALDKPLQESGCTFCGSCIDVCPVNAIVEADSVKHGRQWELKSVDSVCTLCGCACSLSVKTKGDMIAKINARDTDDILERYICAYGRFAFESLYGHNRLKSPMKNNQSVSWQDAVASVAEIIKQSAQKTAIVFSASILNEDIAAIKAFAKSSGIDSLYTTTTLNGYGYIQPDVLQKADLIIIANISPNQKDRFLSAMDAYLMKRFAAGAKLVTINITTEGLNAVATSVLQGDAKQILSDIFSGMDKTDEQLQIAQKALSEAASPVIITEESIYAFVYNNFSAKCAVICLPYEANAVGTALASIAKECFDCEQLSAFDTVIVAGYTCITKRPDVKNFIVLSPFNSELTQQADIALPATANLETSGSIIDFLGRERLLHQTCKPFAEAIPYREIFGLIASSLGEKESLIVKAKYKKNGKSTINEPICKLDVTEQKKLMLQRVSPLVSGSKLLWLSEVAKAEI